MLRRTLLLGATALSMSLGFIVPALADPVTLRIVSKDLSTQNPDDVRELKAIEDAMRAKGTDIHLEIVEVPSAGYADKLTAMLMTGDIPDIIYFQGGDKAIADQGVLEDLTPYIERSEYLKDALFEANKQRLANYPYLLYVFPARVSEPVVRKDWLEKAGLDKPETVDEYVEMFKAFRDGDFDGDGQDNTYGVSTYDTTDALDSIFNQAFGVTSTWMKNDAGEWIPSRVSDAEKAKLEFYAMLVREKLYDPEYITTHWDVNEDKFYSGRSGTIIGTAGEVIDIYGGKLAAAHPDQDTELVLLDPPKGPAGQGLIAIDVSKESRGFAISTTSQHKEEAFKFLDFMASPEGQMIDRLGFEGVHYTKDGDTYNFTDKMATWYARFSQSASWTPPGQWMSEAAAQSLENAQKYFVADNAFVWPADYATYVDQTTQVYRAWVYKFVTGQASMDQWQQYVDEYNAAGGQQMTDYARTVLQ